MPHHLCSRVKTRPRESESYEGHASSSNKEGSASVSRINSVSGQVSPDAGRGRNTTAGAHKEGCPHPVGQAPVLAYYDVRKEVTVQCDASKDAVGAVLLQEGRPVAYVSRKLRESERNWAPIEKEMQAIVFSTQKFREYILGKTDLVHTDHKPLETIMRKPMAMGPLRLQTMILRVSGFDLKVEYLPGKKQVLADTLSRASLNEIPLEEDEFQVNMLERITEAKYTELQQNTPEEVHDLYAIIQAGWPETKLTRRPIVWP